MTWTKKQKLPALHQSGKVKNPDMPEVEQQNYTSTVLKYANLALPFPQLETDAKRVVPAINELYENRAIANPEEPAEQNPLNTVQIAGTVYKIEGGGGGDYTAGAGIYFTGDNNSVINADAGRFSPNLDQYEFYSYSSEDYQGNYSECWVDSGTTVDGHTVYQSNAGTYKMSPGISWCRITVGGYNTFTVYAKQNPEVSGYRYLVFGEPNRTIDLTNNVYALNCKDATDSDYISYEYYTGGRCTVDLMYRSEIPTSGASVDLNHGQFADTGTTVDGHTVYMSDIGSYHIDRGNSVCTLNFSGVTSITVYFRASSEANYDWAYVGNLDENVSTSNYRSRLSGDTAYEAVTYTCSGSSHSIQISYIKDGSINGNDDRAYFYYVINEYVPTPTYEDRAYAYIVLGDPIEAKGEIFNNYSNNHALGQYSHAEGDNTLAVGDNSHVEGKETKSGGYNSHAEGYQTNASGSSSHAEGDGTVASGPRSHAEGNDTLASNENSHAEGMDTQALGPHSHAEGNGSIASGYQSHAEGTDTIASGENSHAEGRETQATALRAHAEGGYTLASANNSHAEGLRTQATANGAHAEGDTTVASGVNSHAEGITTEAVGNNSHAEGDGTVANGIAAHAEGHLSVASGEGSHAEGYSVNSNAATHAIGLGSHAEGNQTKAEGDFSHTEGERSWAFGNASHAENSSVAYGYESHAEGSGTMVGGDFAHTEGAGNQNIANYAHVEGAGNKNIPYAQWSHTEGAGNTNYGMQAHLEGAGNTLSGTLAHVEGAGNQSHGEKTHTEGGGNTVYAYGSHIEGKHNIVMGAANHAEGRQNHIGLTENVYPFYYGQAYAIGAVVGVNATYVGADEYDTSYVYRCITAPGQIQESSIVQIISPATWDANTTYPAGSVVKRVSNLFGDPQFVGYYRTYNESTGQDPLIYGGAWTRISSFLSPFRSNSVYSGDIYLLDVNSELPYYGGVVAKILQDATIPAMWEPVSTPIGSHIEGFGNLITGDYQHVQGKFNAADNTKAFIIGNGTDGDHRSNALTVDWSGNTTIAGDLTTGTTLNTTAQTLGAAINEISVRVPTPPTADGHYTLSLTITNGVPTYGWVSS